MDVPEGGIVQNLVLEGDLNQNTLGMMAVTNDGTIEGCTVLGSISGFNVAGFVYENYGTISNCVSSASVEGTGKVAGITIFNEYTGVITGCKNTGMIYKHYEAANTYREPIGGIAAENYEGTIESCINSGAITNEDGDWGHAGGIAGYSEYSTISGCANNGSINSTTASAGGIVGYGYAMDVSDCHNTGIVISQGSSGTSGGILGTSQDGNISCCYNTGQIQATGSGNSIAGGIVGWIYSASGALLEKCWSSGTIAGRYAGGTAGQIGYYATNTCYLRNCYNTGAVNGGVQAGGIVAQQQPDSSIEGCYNTGNVSTSATSSTETGGICASATSSSAVIKNCYALNENVSDIHGSGARIRRWRNADFENNYAWEKMLVCGQTVADGNAANKDGENISSGQLTASAGTDVWSALPDDVWSKSEGKLPVLIGVDEEFQNASLPQHIVNDAATEPEDITLQGEGTEANPYQITTAEEWAYIASKMNDRNVRDSWLKSSYILTKDLDLSQTVVESAATGGTYYAFQGVLDGNGHKITGMNQNMTGLFAYVGNTGVIKNLIVESHQTQTADGEYLALLAGQNAGTITNCHVSGALVLTTNQSRSAGGIAGTNSGTIENSSASVEIVVSGTQPSAGGVAGSNSGTIRNSNASVELYASGTKPYVAGIAGSNSGTIANCYSTGEVISDSYYAGGIAAYQSGSSASVSGCYSSASVSGTSAGGIMGYLYAGSVTGSVALGEMAAGKTHEGRIARDIRSGATLSENKAWEGMVNANGALLESALTGAADNKNGASVRSGLLQEAAFWEMSGFSTDTWQLQDNMLPALAGQAALPMPLWLVEDTVPVLVGDGTPENPYEINDAKTLSYIVDLMQQDAAYLGASYKLTADIDLTGVTWSALGTESAPFTGIFDGNDHRISHLKLVVNAPYQGFFGVTEGAVIRNLIVQGSVTGADFTGGLVGYAKEGTVIESCQSKIDVIGYTLDGATAGGIVGLNEGTIRHCIQKGSVYTQKAAGGIAGKNAGIIEHCYSIGTLTAGAYGFSDTAIVTGGIAAENEGTIRFCAAMEESMTLASDTGVMAKIAASNTGTLENNYAWSEMRLKGTLVSDDENVGLNGTDSAITLITGKTRLFPADYWVITKNYYPMLIGQTDMNYLLPHQVANGQELIGALSLDLTAPQAGAAPETMLAGEGWSAQIQWTPLPSGIFDYATAYSAVITVSPAEGYVLTGNTVYTLNGTEVEAAAVSGGCVSVSYVFEATADKTPETSESEETDSTEETSDTSDTEETVDTDETADSGQTEDTSQTSDTDESLETTDSQSGQSQDTSDASQSESQKPAGNGDAPKTGDPTAVTLLFAVLLLSAAGICIVLSKKEKDRKDAA